MKNLNKITIVGTVASSELKQSSKGKMWGQFTLESGKNKITCKSFNEDLAREIDQCTEERVLITGSLNAVPYHSDQYDKEFINPFIDVETFDTFSEEAVNNAYGIKQEPKQEQQAQQQEVIPQFEEVDPDGDLPF